MRTNGKLGLKYIRRQKETWLHSLQTNLLWPSYSCTTMYNSAQQCTTMHNSAQQWLQPKEPETHSSVTHLEHQLSAGVEACPRDIWDKLASSSATPRPQTARLSIHKTDGTLCHPRCCFFFTNFHSASPATHWPPAHLSNHKTGTRWFLATLVALHLTPVSE